MKTVLTTMRAVALGLGVVLLAVLTIWFNDSRVAEEGELLTHLSVLLLGMISIAALFRGAWSFGLERRLWLLISGAFIYLALDDYLRIHERIDKRIHKIFQIQETKFTDMLDGVIVLLYGVAAFALVAVFRHIMRQYPGLFGYLGIAFLFLAFMILRDLTENLFFDNKFVEEASKVLSEYFFLLAFVMPTRRDGALLN